MARRSNNVRICRELEDEINEVYTKGNYISKVEASKAILREYKKRPRIKETDDEETFGFR